MAKPSTNPTHGDTAEREPVPLVSEVRIRSFRSIVDLSFEPGRLSVIVGANGSGKSNLLEAVAVAGAGAARKLGHEFLAARGVRPLTPEGLQPRFGSEVPDPWSTRIEIGIPRLNREVGVSPRFEESGELFDLPHVSGPESDLLSHRVDAGIPANELGRALEEAFAATIPGLPTFLIFSPEYGALRTFADEGQILPLGVRGEGLFKHLLDLSARSRPLLDEVNRRLRILDWFDGFVVPSDLGPGEKRLALRDRFLAPDVALDQRATNEGFLFLLFTYVLLISPRTPRFFAIDNADASLNPKLCARMVADMAELARTHDKQVILTTHNPAMLDGLDLADDEQRLFVCERNLDGFTTLRRVPAPAGPPILLSEAFLRGYLGGLPGSF